MQSETKRDIITFFGCIICCVSLGSSFIIPIVMRKPQGFEEETGIQSINVETLPVGATGDYPEVHGWEYAVSLDGLTVVVNKPSGTVENDLLVAFVATDGIEDIYSPSGWTGIAHVESDACSLASYYKVATSSEPSDYTFTWGNSEDCVGSIIRITGANIASPIHVNTTAFESGTGQPLIAPDITTRL